MSSFALIGVPTANAVGVSRVQPLGTLIPSVYLNLHCWPGHATMMARSPGSPTSCFSSAGPGPFEECRENTTNYGHDFEKPHVDSASSRDVRLRMPEPGLF